SAARAVGTDTFTAAAASTASASPRNPVRFIRSSLIRIGPPGSVEDPADREAVDRLAVRDLEVVVLERLLAATVPAQLELPVEVLRDQVLRGGGALVERLAEAGAGTVRVAEPLAEQRQGEPIREVIVADQGEALPDGVAAVEGGVVLVAEVVV